MKKRRIDRDIVLLLISTLITLVSWVGFEVYRAYTKPRIPEILQHHLEPFDPVLDKTVLDQLENRLP
jgi:hypothetical protein